jgi:hypothetical protein
VRHLLLPAALLGLLLGLTASHAGDLQRPGLGVLGRVGDPAGLGEGDLGLLLLLLLLLPGLRVAQPALLLAGAAPLRGEQRSPMRLPLGLLAVLLLARILPGAEVGLLLLPMQALLPVAAHKLLVLDLKLLAKLPLRSSPCAARAE